MECSSLGDTIPEPQLVAAREAELRKGVADVEFHCVEADAHALGDPPVGHSVADLFGHFPFRRSEHVVVRRPAAASFYHDRQRTLRCAELPYPPLVVNFA